VAERCLSKSKALSSNPSQGNDILRTHLAQHLRERVDKWDYMKLKSFCTTKEMVSKLKRPSRMGENVCQLHIKGLITRIYRELKKLNSQNQ
jgi:hypothetical protein